MSSFALISSPSEKLNITVQGYERPTSGEYFDDNWLIVNVEVCAGAFRGKFSATFLTHEFVDFREQLQELYDSLNGEAVFSTLEEQLSIHISGNGLGGIVLRGRASDQAGIGNKLEFEFNLDQTYLVPALRDLNELICLFPVRSLSRVR